MVSISACVGLTLPGMIELPGSFSGSLSSPRPQRGPEPRTRVRLALSVTASRGGARRGRSGPVALGGRDRPSGRVLRRLELAEAAARARAEQPDVVGDLG